MPMSRTARRVITLLAAAVLSLSLVPATVVANHSAAAKPHCASLLTHTPGAGKTAAVSRTRCFSKLAPAVRYAMKGAVVPEDIAPEEIDEVIVPPNARLDPDKTTTIIGIHWEHVDRGGRDRIYFVKGKAPCAGGRVWQIGKLDVGWDGMVSSAEAFGGCGSFEQFRDAKHKGPSRVCLPYCATLGPLNDEVSSVRWKA